MAGRRSLNLIKSPVNRVRVQVSELKQVLQTLAAPREWVDSVSLGQWGPRDTKCCWAPAPIVTWFSSLSALMLSQPACVFHPTSLTHLLFSCCCFCGVSKHTTEFTHVWGEVFISLHQLRRGKKTHPGRYLLRYFYPEIIMIFLPFLLSFFMLNYLCLYRSV